MRGAAKLGDVADQRGAQEASQCPRLDDQPGGRKPGADRRHRGDFVPNAQAVQDADDPFEIEDPAGRNTVYQQSHCVVPCCGV